MFFNPVNLEWGTIPSGQIDYSNFEYLNIPGKELNVNRFTEQISFQEKKQYSVTFSWNLFYFPIESDEVLLKVI